MELLISLRSIRLNGELLPPGAMVKVVDPQPLIDRGYARRLTQAETGSILDGYVAYAKEAFSERPHKNDKAAGKPDTVSKTQRDDLPLFSVCSHLR